MFLARVSILSQIEQRFTELDANQTIYLHCKAGARSLKARWEFFKEELKAD